MQNEIFRCQVCTGNFSHAFDPKFISEVSFDSPRAVDAQHALWVLKFYLRRRGRVKNQFTLMVSFDTFSQAVMTTSSKAF